MGEGDPESAQGLELTNLPSVYYWGWLALCKRLIPPTLSSSQTWVQGGGGGVSLDLVVTGCPTTGHIGSQIPSD